MSIKSRSLVFATFILNCLIVGFLIASFTTEYWISAQARRHNSTVSWIYFNLFNFNFKTKLCSTQLSQGVVNFGLFSGSKDLNVGYGQRAHKINGN